MRGEGAATWEHMKMSCCSVPTPSIQGLHSQLGQTHVEQGALDTVLG